jgi:hypothetical protein
MTSAPQQTLSPEIEPPLPSFATRLRRHLLAPVRLVGALFVPDRALPQAVAAERSGAAFLVIILAALVAAWVTGSRIDLGPTVLAEEDAARLKNDPDTPSRSDRELGEEIGKQRTIWQVEAGMAAGLVTPLWIFGLGVGLLVVGRYVGRYVGGRPTMGRSVAAAAYGSLPAAVKSVLVAVLAWPSAALTPEQVDNLGRVAVFGPPGEGLLRAAAVDVFALWAVVLLGFGLAAAASISRRRAFVTVLVCFVLYQLLTGGAAAPLAGPPPGGPR